MSTAQPSFPPEQVSDAIRAGLSNRSDIEGPAIDAAELAATYRNNLAHYQEHVQKSLADGDYLQAAEKSWGAYAQAIKIIGADHGLHIASHRSILRVSDRLTVLVNQGDGATAQTLTAGLGLARSLHTHFYENDLPPTTVTASVGQVLATIELLQQLFPANVADAGNEDDSEP